jgi:type IV secretion system protein VirD4
VIQLARDQQIILIESQPPIKSKKIFYYEDKFFTARLLPPTFVPTQKPYDPRDNKVAAEVTNTENGEVSVEAESEEEQDDAIDTTSTVDEVHDIEESPAEDSFEEDDFEEDVEEEGHVDESAPADQVEEDVVEEESVEEETTPVKPDKKAPAAKKKTKAKPKKS